MTTQSKCNQLLLVIVSHYLWRGLEEPIGVEAPDIDALSAIFAALGYQRWNVITQLCAVATLDILPTVHSSQKNYLGEVHTDIQTPLGKVGRFSCICEAI